jgi:dihydropteroate synthase
MTTKTVTAPMIMGVMNVTPDSFSGDGILSDDLYVARALQHAQRMIEDGAKIIDVGGESTRPGAQPVTAEEEIRRVIPVIAAIHKLGLTGVTIAVDTTKAVVADAACQVGAQIINDISAMQTDPAIATIAAKHNAYIVLMDNRSRTQQFIHDTKLGGNYLPETDQDIVPLVETHLSERADAARSAGITADKIILDPGIGFGKSTLQNLALIRNIPRLRALGHPILIGASRKSFIGQVLDTSVEDRLEGTAAVVAISAFLGADILRVHDVKFMSRVVTVASTLGWSG